MAVVVSVASTQWKTRCETHPWQKDTMHHSKLWCPQQSICIGISMDHVKRHSMTYCSVCKGVLMSIGRIGLIVAVPISNS